MIEYISHDDINRRKWDEAVSRSFNGLIYAYSWYLDIVSPKWDALVEDNYKTIMPLTWRNKASINYLYPPVCAQQLGVFSSKKLDAKKVDEFIKAIPAKFKYIDMRLNSFNQLNEGYDLKKNVNVELDLIQPYEQLYKAYSSTHKRNIKKANKEGLSIDRKVKVDDIITMFKEGKGKKLKTIKAQDYVILKKVIKAAVSRGKGQVWGVVDKNKKLCAGAFFVHDTNRSIFLFSGVNETGKEVGAMAYLVDQYIKLNSEKAITLDFEGSNDAGVGRFYKGFGARECVYLQLKINRLPPYLKWLKK